jgi:hypothetical protein
VYVVQRKNESAWSDGINEGGSVRRVAHTQAAAQLAPSAASAEPLFASDKNRLGREG